MIVMIMIKSVHNSHVTEGHYCLSLMCMHIKCVCVCMRTCMHACMHACTHAYINYISMCLLFVSIHKEGLSSKTMKTGESCCSASVFIIIHIFIDC